MENKIICDDWSYIKNIENQSIDLICIDPPYINSNEIWDQIEIVNFKLGEELFRVAKQSCSLYVWCGIGEKSQSLIRWFPIFSKYWYFKDLITWKKNRGIGMKKGWLYTREECMWFVKNKNNFIWNKEEQYSEEKRNYIRRGGKSYYKRIPNVWCDINEEMYDKINNDRLNNNWFKNLHNKYPSLHKTIKPVRIIERIIKLHTNENDLVLDCFCGSGTTGVACKNLNRNCILIDNNKEYIEITKNRME